MKRVFTWPAVCVAVGLVLFAAAFAFLNGTEGLGVALLVVAACEAVFGSAMVLITRQGKSRSA
jgi:hypothetical protein